MKLTLLLPLFLAGCGAILDFDDVEGLPCPCDPDHVCLVASDKCVPRHSVDMYKSCSKDTNDRTGDDLCPANAICQEVNGKGPRCLPRCVPTTYATPEAGAAIASQCPVGFTCWDTDRGGVCSEGVCRDNPSNCPATQQCLFFNGAGICFTKCSIFETAPDPCGGDQLCHPIGVTDITACVPQGTREINDQCDHENMCRAKDSNSRPMACGRPMQSSQTRRCNAICIHGNGARCYPSLGEGCQLFVPNVDPVNHADLGLCL